MIYYFRKAQRWLRSTQDRENYSPEVCKTMFETGKLYINKFQKSMATV